MNEQIFQAEEQYDRNYRARVWKSLWEDREKLGMGYRAYHSHMFTNFEFWASRGYKFLNAHGGEINIDELKPDDLNGFLGKRSEVSAGPARQITHNKLSVIDVYFKAKYPALAVTFSQTGAVSSLSDVLSQFFYKHNVDRVENTVSENSGVYLLYDGDFRDKISDLHLGNLSDSIEYIPAYKIVGDASQQRIFVHKALFPFHIRDARPGSNLEKVSKRKTFKIDGPYIGRPFWDETGELEHDEYGFPKEGLDRIPRYEGAALQIGELVTEKINRYTGKIDVVLYAILRDTQTYEPAIEELAFVNTDKVFEDVYGKVHIVAREGLYIDIDIFKNIVHRSRRNEDYRKDLNYSENFLTKVEEAFSELN